MTDDQHNDWIRNCYTQTSFALSEEERKRVEVFCKEVESRRAEKGFDNYAGASGGATSFIFTPTSIGLIKVVSHFGEELDLTDYEGW